MATALRPPSPRILKKNVKDIKAKHRKGWLSVSDFTSLLWCEQKAFYNATSSIVQPASAEMKTGNAIHRELESKVMPESKVVQTATKEDWWAVKLLDMVAAINVLLDTGIAREVPVIGRVGPFLTYGIVDQIERRCMIPNSKDEPAVPHYAYVLSDTKTRSAKSMPNASQRIQNKFQVSLYTRLLNQLSGNDSTNAAIPRRPWTATNERSESLELFFFQALSHLDPSKTFSLQVQSYARELLCEPNASLSAESLDLDGPPQTLSTLLPIALDWFKFIPRVSETMEIEYRWQKDPSIVIGCQKELYDNEWVENKIERGVAFWQGRIECSELDGAGTIEEVSFKCNSCIYQPDCDWLERQQEKILLQEGQRTSV
ncbi:exonuclease V [Obelidium mucronatum]|nr:exonuclease V [Obelidium mucronatum]